MDYSKTRTRSIRTAAFTIIELLVVIAVIGILMGITFGITRGVNERGRISQAQTALAALSQALEAYKTHYGDYPQVTAVDAESRWQTLYDALNGRRGPTGDLLNPPGRVFIEHENFSLKDPNLPDSPGNYLLDPWSRPYEYHYKDTGNWENPSYVLYSRGPSGESAGDNDLDPEGYPNYQHEANLDNIYANRL